MSNPPVLLVAVVVMVVALQIHLVDKNPLAEMS